MSVNVKIDRSFLAKTAARRLKFFFLPYRSTYMAPIKLSPSSSSIRQIFTHQRAYQRDRPFENPASSLERALINQCTFHVYQRCIDIECRVCCRWNNSGFDIYIHFLSVYWCFRVRYSKRFIMVLQLFEAIEWYYVFLCASLNIYTLYAIWTTTYNHPKRVLNEWDLIYHP